MEPRLNPYTTAPDTMKAMLALQEAVSGSGLEPSLVGLVETRASQINGCAYCIHMHTQNARANGVSEARLYLLNAWRESPLYSDRERAALGWTEALTRIADTHAPDTDYQALAEQFSADEQVKLTLLIVTINAWNRFAVGFRAVHPIRAADRPAAEQR